LKKDTFYFSHDYNARLDDKIKQLIRKHGLLGYGCYWAIIEDLYNNANALRLDYDGIAFDLRINIEQAKSIINDFDLFVIDAEQFGSMSVERRLNERIEKSAKASQSANLRWQKHKDDANAMRTQSDGNAIKERKGKEIKEIKENLFNDFWNLYDKKVERKSCYNKFMKLDLEVIEKIINVVPFYVESTPNSKYRKNPETWINGECWNDEIKAIEKPTQNEFTTSTGAKMIIPL
jgi:hypothetical protein